MRGHGASICILKNVYFNTFLTCYYFVSKPSQRAAGMTYFCRLAWRLAPLWFTRQKVCNFKLDFELLHRISSVAIIEFVIQTRFFQQDHLIYEHHFYYSLMLGYNTLLYGLDTDQPTCCKVREV